VTWVRLPVVGAGETGGYVGGRLALAAAYTNLSLCVAGRRT
jgi:hypothetical protein